MVNIPFAREQIMVGHTTCLEDSCHFEHLPKP
jgi:hypothetical protein